MSLDVLRRLSDANAVAPNTLENERDSAAHDVLREERLDYGAKMAGNCPTQRCDERNRPTARFCARCGAGLDRDAVQATRLRGMPLARKAWGGVATMFVTAIVVGLTATEGAGGMLWILPLLGIGIVAWLKSGDRPQRQDP